MADRSKFKATPINKMKAVVEEEDKAFSSGSKNNYITIEEGINKIRLAPAFPGEDNFYQIKVQHWIPLEDNNGDEIRRTVLNAKTHGNTKKDIIEEYVSFAKLSLDASKQDDEEKLSKITDWKIGLLPQTSWMAYAWKINGDDKKFGIFEFKKSVRDQINEACIIEDDEDAIEIDPFTDPDEGKRITITYKSKAKPADKYKIRVAEKASPLSDEELDELEKNKPLSETLKNVYTSKDFEKALEGLRFFDNKHDIGLFDEEGFQDIIDTLKSKYKSVEKDEPKSKPSIKSTPKVVKKAVEEDNDEDYEEDEDADDEPAPKKAISKTSSPFKEDKKPTKKVEEEDEDIEDEADDEEEEEKPKMSKIEELKAKMKKRVG